MKKSGEVVVLPLRSIFLIFLVEHGLVPIGPEQDVRHPVRRSAHLLANHIQVNIRTAFDDQLIMNVTDAAYKKLVSDTSYGSLWEVSFTLKEF